MLSRLRGRTVEYEPQSRGATVTVVVALVDPPREGLVLPELVESTPLSESDAVTLYEAFVEDLCRATAASGGDLLLNYRPDDELPEEFQTDDAVEPQIRELASNVLSGDDLDETRIEVQVGSTESGRVGNTVTHLLDEEEVDSVTICDPAAPLRSRQHIDSIAMKLRRSAVVLGPAARGRIHTAAFRETIDFADALTPPALVTLSDHARDADHDVDFAPQQTVVETHDDLLGLLSELRARQTAGRWMPTSTTRAVADLGLRIDTTSGDPRVARD